MAVGVFFQLLASVSELVNLVEERVRNESRDCFASEDNTGEEAWRSHSWKAVVNEPTTHNHHEDCDL